MKRRITKGEYDGRGGMTNYNLFRKQDRSGRWKYYQSQSDET